MLRKHSDYLKLDSIIALGIALSNPSDPPSFTATSSEAIPLDTVASSISPERTMPIDFYYLPGSAPCRSVWMLAKALNVDLNLHETNLMKGEQMTPAFLKVCATYTYKAALDAMYRQMIAKKRHV